MKKLVSWLIVLSIMFGCFACVSASADTNYVEAEYPCYKKFDVFRFDDSYYRADLSSGIASISCDDYYGASIVVDGSNLVSTAYFDVSDSNYLYMLNAARATKTDGGRYECNLATSVYSVDENAERYSLGISISLLDDSFKTLSSTSIGDLNISQVSIEPQIAKYLCVTIRLNGEGELVIPGLNLSKIYFEWFSDGCNKITETTERTCGTPGQIRTYCTVCGYVFNSYLTAPTGKHTIVEGEAVEPTCSAVGYTVGTYCLVCGYNVTRKEIPKLKHTEVIDKAVAATCTADGKTEGKHCSACNKVIIKQETVKAAGHKNEWVETAATYFNEGKKELKCAVCGEVSKTETIAKLRLKMPDFKLIKAKGKFKVKLNNSACFQVRYKIKGKWKTKTFNSKKNTAKVIKNLKKGSYKVQIRSFVKSGKQKAYSSWSKVRKIKVK